MYALLVACSLLQCFLSSSVADGATDDRSLEIEANQIKMRLFGIDEPEHLEPSETLKLLRRLELLLAAMNEKSVLLTSDAEMMNVKYIVAAGDVRDEKCIRNYLALLDGLVKELQDHLLWTLNVVPYLKEARNEQFLLCFVKNTRTIVTKLLSGEDRANMDLLTASIAKAAGRTQLQFPVRFEHLAEGVFDFIGSRSGRHLNAAALSSDNRPEERAQYREDFDELVRNMCSRVSAWLSSELDGIAGIEDQVRDRLATPWVTNIRVCRAIPDLAERLFPFPEKGAKPVDAA